MGLVEHVQKDHDDENNQDGNFVESINKQTTVNKHEPNRLADVTHLRNRSETNIFLFNVSTKNSVTIGGNDYFAEVKPGKDTPTDECCDHRDGGGKNEPTSIIHWIAIFKVSKTTTKPNCKFK